MITETPKPARPEHPTLGPFLEALAAFPDGYKALEIGTRRWVESTPTHHCEWFPRGFLTMSDGMPGLDVDVVADAHNLTATFGRDAFHAFAACSVWEHLERPWIAAREVIRVLKPGGIFFVQTHQTFPIHGYPHDFFRFSDAALKLIFEDAGAIGVISAYEFPARIVSERCGEQKPAWLNVCAFGRKRR